MNGSMKSWCFLLTFLIQIHLTANETYTTCFEGILPELLTTIEAHSQLKILEKRPPSNFFSLKCRAQSDASNILNVLHANGYYDAEVHFEFLATSPAAK